MWRIVVFIANNRLTLFFTHMLQTVLPTTADVVVAVIAVLDYVDRKRNNRPVSK